MKKTQALHPLAKAVKGKRIATSTTLACTALMLATAAPVPAQAALSADSATSPVQASSRQIVTIIDGGLADAALLADHGSGTVYHLDPARDGIIQITEILSRHQRIDAVHLMSHGGPGYLALGNAILNKASLSYYQSDLAQWQQALSPHADLMIYGCDAAQGPQGELFINRLGALTGADVAASNDVTGHPGGGGDWDLEYRVGGVTAGSLSVSQYMHTMGPSNYGDFIVGDGSGGGGGGTGYDDGTDIFAGNGGNGGGSNDGLRGTDGDDVIFGDGSGGGGAGQYSGGADNGPGTGGLGGSGNDVIIGGAGNDILFGDGFDGFDGDYDGGDGGIGGGGGGGGGAIDGSDYTGGNGGIGAGGGGGGDYSYGGDGGIGGGGGGGGGSTDTDYGGSGGGLGATDGTSTSSDAGGGGGGGGFFGFGGTGAVYSDTPAGSGGNGGNPKGQGNGGNGCDGGESGNDGDYSGGGGGGGFGNADGGDTGCDQGTPAEISGQDGEDGNTSVYRFDDSDGSVYSFVSGQLSTVLDDAAGFGDGDDALDGGAGDDDLFGMGGADTFVFQVEDGDVEGSSNDEIWDFDAEDGDRIILAADGKNAGSEAVTTVIGAQTSSDADRLITWADDTNSTTIRVRDIGRDLVAGDFDTESNVPKVSNRDELLALAAALDDDDDDDVIGATGLSWLAVFSFGLFGRRRRQR